MKYEFSFIFDPNLSLKTEITFPSGDYETPDELVSKATQFKFLTLPDGHSINIEKVKIIQFKAKES